VASDGIGVSLVELGSIDTGIWGEAEAEMEGRRGSRYEDAYRRSLAQLGLSRPFRGTPERVARVIATVLTARPPPGPGTWWAWMPACSPWPNGSHPQ
jgi:NAD(P)-dependent dehydrogenase (short-subunit alcohol dehydrogenase family)